MRIQPTSPSLVFRAYGVSPPAQPKPAAMVQPTPRADPSAESAPRVSAAARLIGAVVPGRVDFSGDTPAPVGSALPMYRHPADRNAAATGIHAGRLIDVKG